MPPTAATGSDGDESSIFPESTILLSPGQSTVAQIERERKLRISLYGTSIHAASGVTYFEKSREATALSFIGVYRKSRVAAPAGMCDMISATSQRSFIPGVNNVKRQRSLYTNGVVQAVGGLPGAKANTGDIFAYRSRGMK